MAIVLIKFNDLVMNLAHHTYSLIVHTKGLCPGAAGEASWWSWHLRRWETDAGWQECAMQAVQGPCGSRVS